MRTPATDHQSILQLDPRDNVLIALRDLAAGDQITHTDRTYTLVTGVPAKHKFATADLAPGDPVYMYGVLVARARVPVRQGEWISTRNVHHDAATYRETAEPFR